MNDRVRQQLAEMIQAFGPEVCDDPKRVRALLADLCPGCKREVQVLTAALEQRVANDLLTRSDNLPWEVVSGRLVQRLNDELAMTEEAARWAVESWAVALGKGPPDGATAATEMQRGPETTPQAPPSQTLPQAPPPPVRGPASGSRRTPPPVRQAASGNGTAWGLLVPVLLLGGIGVLAWLANRANNSEQPRGGAGPDAQTISTAINSALFRSIYEPNSLRFQGEQLVIDLVLTNSTPYDLDRVDCRISSRGQWEQKLDLASWKQGQQHRVTVPVRNNDLDAYHQPSMPAPPFGVKGSAWYQSGLPGETSIAISGGTEADALSPWSGTGAVAWQPWNLFLGYKVQLLGDSSQGVLHLGKKPGRLPSLGDVQLLVVGYVDKQERHRQLYPLGPWTEEQVKTVPIPYVRFTEFKIRGIGRQATVLGSQPQTFYICDNVSITWDK